MNPILVTGATGNVGREVAAALRASGLSVRAAGRPGAASRSKDGVPLDFTRAETFGPALAGVRGVFLMRPPAIARMRDTLNRFLDAAAEARVEHVVFLSVAGAEANRLVPHRAVEDHLAAGPLSWTVLRPGFFAQNLGDAYLRDITEDDRLYVPAGHRGVTFVDVRDLADVSVRAFTRPEEHRGRAYTLTGPSAVTFDDAARLLTEATGRPIRYEAATVLGYVSHLRRRGMPWAQVAVQTILHVGLRFGQAESVDPTLEALLGRPGRSLATYVRDHADVFARRPREGATAQQR